MRGAVCPYRLLRRPPSSSGWGVGCVGILPSETDKMSMPALQTALQALQTALADLALPRAIAELSQPPSAVQ